MFCVHESCLDVHESCLYVNKSCLYVMHESCVYVVTFVTESCDVWMSHTRQGVKSLDT